MDVIEPADQLQGIRGKAIPKVITGIEGFDEISCGGLPRGRLTVIIGSSRRGQDGVCAADDGESPRQFERALHFRHL